MKGKDLHEYHRYLDEAGDTTFYGKGKRIIIGEEGVSKSFMIGMLKLKEPIDIVRAKILHLKQDILNNSYFYSVPSVKKKIENQTYYFHATDDIPEVRMKFYELIKSIDCSFEAVVGRKIPAIFEKSHNSQENEFYTDLLSHLLKNKFATLDKLVLNIAERGSSTNNKNLEKALISAKTKFSKNYKGKDILTEINFNIQNQTSEPILNIADYFCWSIQRVFERGETRYYDYLSEKISLVIDLYDTTKYGSWDNYYSNKKRLTKAVMLK
jgi:hypothetical protein